MLLLRRFLYSWTLHTHFWFWTVLLLVLWLVSLLLSLKYYFGCTRKKMSDCRGRIKLKNLKINASLLACLQVLSLHETLTAYKSVYFISTVVPILFIILGKIIKPTRRASGKARKDEWGGIQVLDSFIASITQIETCEDTEPYSLPHCLISLICNICFPYLNSIACPSLSSLFRLYAGFYISMLRALGNDVVECMIISILFSPLLATVLSCFLTERSNNLPVHQSDELAFSTPRMG